MLATIAICTLNRAESLRRTLNSLVALRVPDDIVVEIVIVNNGSADHTDKVIAEYAGRLPVRREWEPRRGVSHARNRAVGAAKGEYILWTDDDVVVDPAWLTAYVEAFRRWPGAAVFGGRIVPLYEPPVTEWLRTCEHLLSYVYGIRDFGDSPVSISRGHGPIPFGANFAVRAAEQRRFPYDPELGLAPGRRRLGSETTVISNILATGAIGYWIPTARVEHCVGRENQTTRHIARYFAAEGETAALVRKERETGPRLLGVPRWMWRRLAECWISYHVHRLISPAPIWIVHLKKYGFAKGNVMYWWNNSRRAKRAAEPR